LADFQRMSQRAHQLGIKNFTWDHFALEHFTIKYIIHVTLPVWKHFTLD
jgi:hypothetical protein